MVKTISSFLFLLLLTIQVFSFCVNYKLTKPFYDSNTASFISPDASISDKFTTSPVQLDSVIKPLVTCSSTNVAGVNWNFSGSYTSCGSEFAISIWINFASTVYGTTPILTIGNTANGYPNTYKMTSNTEGTLTLSYTGTNSGDHDSNDDKSMTVPENEWTLLTLFWPYNEGSSQGIIIYIQNQWKISTKGTTYYFYPPTNGKNIMFGAGITASIYQILGYDQAYQSQSVAGGLSMWYWGSEYNGNMICDNTCSDTYCLSGSNFRSICLASTTDCIDCDTNGCNKCKTPGRSTWDYCSTVLFTCSSHCVDCTSGTVCTQCEPGYFLYKKAGSVTCVDCTTSCSSCNPGPTCYTCADSIEDDGSACRVDKIGFQTSFSGNNIGIAFASPLVSAVTLSSIAAKSTTGNSIDTTNWQMNACAANSDSCTVVTDTVSDSDLPFEIEFELIKA